MGPKVFGHEFISDIEVYVLTAIIVFLTTALMYLFSRTPAGRMANAVRDNAERAEFLGYSQRYVRFISFCASGFFAGIAGGLFAINYEILTEENLNLVTSGWVLLMAYVGGVGYFVGPLIGAVLLTLLQTVLSNHTEIWRLYLGILFLLTVMYAPNGLTGLVMMHGPAWQAGCLHRLIWPYMKALPSLLAFLLGTIALLEMTHHLNASGTAAAVWGGFWSGNGSGRGMALAGGGPVADRRYHRPQALPAGAAGGLGQRQRLRCRAMTTPALSLHSVKKNFGT